MMTLIFEHLPDSLLVSGSIASGNMLLPGNFQQFV